MEENQGGTCPTAATSTGPAGWEGTGHGTCGVLSRRLAGYQPAGAPGTSPESKDPRRAEGPEHTCPNQSSLQLAVARESEVPISL